MDCSAAAQRIARRTSSFASRSGIEGGEECWRVEFAPLSYLPIGEARRSNLRAWRTRLRFVGDLVWGAALQCSGLVAQSVLFKFNCHLDQGCQSCLRDASGLWNPQA